MGLFDALKSKPGISSNVTARAGPEGSDDEELDIQKAQCDTDADISNQDDEMAERQLDKDLLWAVRAPQSSNLPHLERPVVVPQTSPGMANLFKRAWAPELARHDVKEEEWLQFVDHLNICKTGSPPLQVLNLAGTVVGFVPLGSAQIAGMASNFVAAGGMFAVGKVRITRYLKRANVEYFAPRGLVVRIAKEANIQEITRQPSDASLLGNTSSLEPGLSMSLDVIDRRMQAFGDYVAPLQYDNLAAPQQEKHQIDKLAAKMNALKASRNNKQNAIGEDISKHQMKSNESRAEREAEAREIRERAERKIARKPRKAEKIERRMQKSLAELDEDAASDEDKHRKKSGKGGEKAGKKMSRLMFIVVQDLDVYMRQQPQA